MDAGVRVCADDCGPVRGNGFPHVEKAIVRLSAAELARLVGHYKVDSGGAGEFDLVGEGVRILLRSTELQPLELPAESPGKLFFRDDGSPVDVAMQNGSTALTIAGGLHAVKVHWLPVPSARS